MTATILFSIILSTLFILWMVTGLVFLSIAIKKRPIIREWLNDDYLHLPMMLFFCIILGPACYDIMDDSED
jgi:hypothetical protein